MRKPRPRAASPRSGRWLGGRGRRRPATAAGSGARCGPPGRRGRPGAVRRTRRSPPQSARRPSPVQRPAPQPRHGLDGGLEGVGVPGGAAANDRAGLQVDEVLRHTPFRLPLKRQRREVRFAKHPMGRLGGHSEAAQLPGSGPVMLGDAQAFALPLGEAVRTEAGQDQMFHGLQGLERSLGEHRHHLEPGSQHRLCDVRALIGNRSCS
mmetsp:Transcript_89794/g.290105  ORF Transcript_89794/g.290105 Transcript_89794/m.290105 type:complete len:208 (-) Transcript_89794:257-880(-)